MVSYLKYLFEYQIIDKLGRDRGMQNYIFMTIWTHFFVYMFVTIRDGKKQAKGGGR